MAIAPAVGLGMLVVFLLGAGVTFLILGRIQKSRRVGQAQNMGVWERWELETRSEKRTERIAIAGGLLAVLLLILSFFILPREWFYGAWIVLTIVGVIFGIFTFYMNGKPGNVKIYGETPPSKSGNLPPQPGAPVPPAPSPTSDNPYRDLLIKVKYDQALAERLIAYERTRAPNASVDELCRNVIARLERDSR